MQQVKLNTLLSHPENILSEWLQKFPVPGLQNHPSQHPVLDKSKKQTFNAVISGCLLSKCFTRFTASGVNHNGAFDGMTPRTVPFTTRAAVLACREIISCNCFSPTFQKISVQSTKKS